MDADIRRDLASAVLAEMNSAASRPVQWGIDDCALFAANPIWKALGYDPASAWRGRYNSREGALKLLGRMGLGFALRRAAKRHGWLRIDPGNAVVGDVGLSIFPVSETETAITTLICRAPGWFVARSDNGFTAVKSDLVRTAWRIIP